MKKLTVGMPVYDDFNGVYFSVQALRCYHAEVMPFVDILVIDNAPQTKAGEATRAFCESVKARYIAHETSLGPAGAKSAVFDHAECDYVLCMDSHVMLMPGSLRRLLDYYTLIDPEGAHLYQGPLIHDGLAHVNTHFAPGWSGGMYGTWAKHEAYTGKDGQPFDIPMQGMGVFTCRRDAWLGFNPHFHGFGGEEGYIHDKFRRHGRRTLCLPWLEWLHRFGRPNGVEYKVLWEDRIRNYLIGWHENGNDLAPILEHFCQHVGPDVTENTYNAVKDEFGWHHLPPMAKPWQSLSSRDLIAKYVTDHRIAYIQLDLVGQCNTACWFCPVRHTPLPEAEREPMPLASLDRVLSQIDQHRGGLVDSGLNHVYLSHYSETLLYPHFEALFERLRQHRLMATLMTNAVALSPERIDTLCRYVAQVAGISINLPAANADAWAAYTGGEASDFARVAANIDALEAAFAELGSDNKISISVNGLSDQSLAHGKIDVLEHCPISDFDNEFGESATAFAAIKARWPRLNVAPNFFLSDRAGLLAEHHVISHAQLIAAKKGAGLQRVVGCQNIKPGRPFAWLHISPTADLFLCCNDYHYQYRFGNLVQNDLADIWGSEAHLTAVDQAFAGICSRCSHAEWGPIAQP